MSDTTLNFPDKMPLRLAGVYLDMGEQRLRTLAREGQVPGADNSEGVWIFTKEGLEEFKLNRATSPRKAAVRGDGKAFIVRIPIDKLAAAKDALGKLGIELQNRYDYAKQKEYQAKRRVAKAAAKAAKATAEPAEDA